MNFILIEKTNPQYWILQMIKFQLIIFDIPIPAQYQGKAIYFYMILDYHIVIST